MSESRHAHLEKALREMAAERDDELVPRSALCSALGLLDEARATVAHAEACRLTAEEALARAWVARDLARDRIVQAREEEREACARLAEESGTIMTCYEGGDEGDRTEVDADATKRMIAAAIRTKGKA